MESFSNSKNYILILISLINFILSAWWGILFGLNSNLVTVISFSLVILASFNSSIEKFLKILLIILGVWAILISWCEYSDLFNRSITSLRMWVHLLNFIFILFIIIRYINNTERVGLDIIIGMMSGFILLGIIGGVCFELLDYYYPGSISTIGENNSFKYYYFSFMNLTSVGFGDIFPLNTQSRSVSVVLGLFGQFYLAFGVSVFIGKYLNQQNESKNEINGKS